MEKIEVYPVVHMSSVRHAVEQAQIAQRAGANGVFLINHHQGWRELAQAALAVKETVGGFVGVNALDLDAREVFEQLVPVAPVDAVWSDNAGIDEESQVQEFAEQVEAARASNHCLYFGGVAFKYQRAVTDLANAAKAASRYMDVLCTSGPGTGMAADEWKIRELAANASVPVAIASGVGVGNLETYARAGARYFLVASSIGASWEELHFERTRELLDLAVRINKERTSMTQSG